MAQDLNQDHINRIKAAMKLASKNSKLEADFIEAIFTMADKEDLTRLSADEIAQIGHRSFEAFAAPFDGTHRIEIIDPVFERDKAAITNQVSIIELHNINKPFLVDSIIGELQSAELDIHLVLHPILTVERDADHKLLGLHDRFAAQTNPELQRESVIHVHVSRLGEKADRAALIASLDAILGDVEAVVSGWKPMLLRLEEIIAIFKITPPPLPQDDISETIAFLSWLVENNFTLLGMREYAFDGKTEDGELKRTQRPGLGLLRNPEVSVLRRGNQMVTMTPEIREFLMRPEPLIITKANVKTKVHRRAYMDYIGIKLYNERGALNGELRIVGLFTSTTYNRSATNIPFLRRKVANTVAAAAVDPRGHSGKALLNILEGYPRDELFQVDEETLLANSQEILRLHQRPRVRILSRVDKFDRFVSCLVYVPRDRYNTSVRLQIGDYLKDHLWRTLVRCLSGHSRWTTGPCSFHHRAFGRQDPQPGPGNARRSGQQDSPHMGR